MSELDELEIEGPAGEAGTSDVIAPAAPDTRDAADTGETPGAVPYLRFKEVNDRDKQYREFGKPDEVKARLAKLSAFEAKEAEAETERQRVASEESRRANPKQAEVDDLIRDSVNRQYPGVATVEAIAARQKEQERLVVATYVQRSDDHIVHLMRDHKIEVTPQSFASYKKMVESEVLSDEALTKSYWEPANQDKAMDEAFTRVKTIHINPALQAAGARTLDQARERRSRTLDRAAPSGTAHAKPLEFQSKNPKGTAAHERDRAAYRDAQMDAFLDASGFDEEGGVAL